MPFSFSTSSSSRSKGWKINRTRIWLWLLPALSIYAFFAHRFWFVTDDAFISFRYAGNWADGLGLRYNMGVEPPVEGFSNFLWTALMALVRTLGGDMVAVAPWLSFLLGVILILMVFRHLAGSGSSESDSKILLPGLAVLFLALFPPFTLWSTGGLETMLFGLLLFAAYDRLLFGEPSTKRGIAAGVAAALLALTRPEGVIWGLALAGLYAAERLFRGERPVDRRAGVYVLILAAVSAVFLGLRVWYFERWLPNTAYAKVGLNAAVLERGAVYVAHFCLTFVTPALLFIALVLRPILARASKDPGAPAAAGALWRRAGIMALGFAAWSIASGGDFMAMGRFLAPAAPYFAILFAILGARLISGAVMPRAAAALALIGLLAAQTLPAFGADLLPESFRRSLCFRWNTEEVLSEYEQWRFMCENKAKWSAAGRVLRERAPDGGSVVCFNIGAVGYYSELFVHDTCGLVDPDVAEWPSPPDSVRFSAGHDKWRPVTDYFRLRPTFLAIKVASNITAHEFVYSLEQMLPQLPPGYKVTTVPLDRIEEAPSGHTLVLLERL